MGAPSITISFIEKAMTAVTRGERGIVMLWVKDTLAAPAVNPVTVVTEKDIPLLKSSFIAFFISTFLIQIALL